MSVEKIDLADVEQFPPFVAGEVMSALVRAVRAAQAFADCSVMEDAAPRYVDLCSALAPFTDSANEFTAGRMT